MAFIPVPNTAQFNIHQLLFGVPVENTLSFEQDEPWTAGDLAAATVGLQTWWEDEIAPLLSADITLVRISGRALDTASSPVWENPVIPSVPGTVVSPSMPGNVAFVVSLRTGLAGRSFRGRNYVAGIPDNVQTSNVVSQTFADNLINAYSALVGTQVLVPGILVIVSRQENKAPRTTGVTTNVQSVITVDLTLDTQRGRLQ